MIVGARDGDDDEKTLDGVVAKKPHGVDEEDDIFHDASVQSLLKFKGGFAKGLRRDIERRRPYYKSDWTDAFTAENFSQSLSSICFLFFACLAPAIAFGTIYDTETEGMIGVVECILASGFAGVTYSLTSGQPLCILGGTGPNLAYTVAFYQICNSMDIDFLAARVWQGLWCSLFTIIFAVTDASALMSHVTRYVEEIFSALITLIFVYEALKSVIDSFYKRSTEAAFMTTILCFATYIIAIQLKGLKQTKYFTPAIRHVVASFAVTIAILIVSGVANNWNNVDVEWLSVPADIEPSFKPKADGKPRPWLINPFGGQGLNKDGVERDLPTWAIFFCIIPGTGMALLNYLDQNLTTK
jgi:hypothetical protein